jgi:hypothetical protein
MHYCTTDLNATQLSVKLNPDPIVTGKQLEVTISGKLNVDIPDSSQNVVADVTFLFTDALIIPVNVEFCKWQRGRN